MENESPNTVTDVMAFGNQNLAKGTREHPVVTFVLLAYNQKKYIREAVEGALSQTYSPLEIILSDDCSTDGTYETMLEMATQYTGAKSIVVRRNKQNQGLIEHINSIILESSSEIVVLAAGDDISEAHRTERTADLFLRDPKALLVHSNVSVIGDQAGLERLRPSVINSQIDAATIATSGNIYIGATGAIRKRLLDIYGHIGEPDAYEDLVLGFRAVLMKGLRHIDEELVRYRKGIGISSQFNKEGGNRFSLRKKRVIHTLAVLKQRLRDSELTPVVNHMVIRTTLLDEISRVTLRLRIYESPMRFAIHLVSRPSRSALRVALTELRYALGLID